MTTQELNNSDVKLLSMISPYLESLQVFIDSTVKDAGTMPTKLIYQKFSDKHNNLTISRDNFINAFRLAVRVGRIKNLIGAKRAGYRHVEAVSGTKSQSTEERILESIEPHIDNLQSFVDKNIQGTVRMTAATIYDKFRITNECGLSQGDFVKAFRVALKQGKIIGLESAYKFGYKRAGMVSTISKDDEDDRCGSDPCEIIIDDYRKIVPLDKLNWGLQVKKDSGSWSTEAYFNSGVECLRSIARKLMDDELRSMHKFDLEHLETKVKEAEDRIANLLLDIMNKDREKAA